MGIFLRNFGDDVVEEKRAILHAENCIPCYNRLSEVPILMGEPPTVTVGRHSAQELRAVEILRHIIAHIHSAFTSMVDDDVFSFPLTDEEYAEALGVTIK